MKRPWNSKHVDEKRQKILKRGTRIDAILLDYNDFEEYVQTNPPTIRVSNDVQFRTAWYKGTPIISGIHMRTSDHDCNEANCDEEL